MTTQELKDYLNRAKDLEAAIYTQRELVTSYESYSKLHEPQKPIWKNIPFKEVKPVLPERQERTASDDNMMVWMGIFAAFFMIMGFGFFRVGSVFMTLFSIVGAVLCCLITKYYKNLSETDKQYDSRIDEYKKSLEHYEELKEIWENESLKAKERYEKFLIEYNNNVQDYFKARDAKIEQYSQVLDSLIQALQAHYASGIIFEKYRTFTAIATMAEYLQSGRCSTLEGADGAYNMYEMELRQNIVIGQLSAIVSNLDQIKNNQYTLYQEIVRANQTVSELMAEVRDMNSTAKETAYFAAVSALIAASPKVSYGYVFS